MRKKILFIAPPYMDLYKDIISELNNQGYEVDYLPEKSYKDDPYNIRGYSRFSKIFARESNFNKKINKEWKGILGSSKYNKPYDILFVLDGQSIRPIVFEILKSRNRNFKSVNYLFDTTTGVYRFDKAFNLFDKVYTFDIAESIKYNIELLPIYWVDEKEVTTNSFNIFGLGAIKDERYLLFNEIKKIAEVCGKTYYLRLYNFIKTKNLFFYKVRCFIYRLLGQRNLISTKAILSEYSTTESMSPKEFRKMIASCEIVIDTSAPHQDGMTARFMWALGLGRKIITTNTNVKSYDFYSQKQILVYTNETKRDDIIKFINTPFFSSNQMNDNIAKYRLDNWISLILNFK